MIEKDKTYIFYDGNCGFCNFWVHWVLKNDKKNQFLFASLQGKLGRNFLLDRNLETENLNTIYLWKPEKYYFKKSNAILEIAENLGGMYAALKIFRIIPKFIRDYLYDIVAKNRNRIMQNSCKIPTEQEKKKFLD